MNDVILNSVYLHLISALCAYMQTPSTVEYTILLMVLLQDLRGFKSCIGIENISFENKDFE